MPSSLSSGRPNSVAGTGHKVSTIAADSEFYDCKRFCTMFDKPYIARYERKAGKLFRLVGTFKDEATAGGGTGKRSSVVLRFDQIDGKTTEERCAWCGVKDIVCCSSCKFLVCRAHVTKRDGGLYFKCRASCPGKGMLTETIETFEASKQSAPSREPGCLSLPVKENGGALPSGRRLRLKD